MHPVISVVVFLFEYIDTFFAKIQKKPLKDKYLGMIILTCAKWLRFLSYCFYSKRFIFLYFLFLVFEGIKFCE